MFSCEYCKGIGFHRFNCPNYISSNSHYNCSICNEGIQNGEEYIVNDDNDYAHWECVDYAKDLVKFLGYDVKEMDDENEK